MSDRILPLSNKDKQTIKDISVLFPYLTNNQIVEIFEYIFLFQLEQLKKHKRCNIPYIGEIIIDDLNNLTIQYSNTFLSYLKNIQNNNNDILEKIFIDKFQVILDNILIQSSVE